MYEFLATEEYASQWIVAPVWIIAAIVFWKRGIKPGRISRVRYWSIAFLVGCFYAALLPPFWIISANNESIGIIYLCALVLGVGCFQAWWAIGRAQDIGKETAALPAFSWFPIVGLFLVFGRPTDNKFRSPDWRHGLKRFGGLLLAVFTGLFSVLVSSLIFDEDAYFARAELEEKSPSDMVAEIVQETKIHLPIEVDNITVMTGVSGSGSHLIYQYEIAKKKRDLPSDVEVRLAKTVLPNVCADVDTLEFMDIGITPEYRYSSSDGNKLASFVASHQICADVAKGDFSEFENAWVEKEMRNSSEINILLNVLETYYPDDKTKAWDGLKSVILDADNTSEGIGNKAFEVTAEIRRRHAPSLLQAPDENLKEVLQTNIDALEKLKVATLSCNAFLIEGAPSLVGNNIVNHVEYLQASVHPLYKAMKAGDISPSGRSEATDQDWETFAGELLDAGMSEEDFLSVSAPNKFDVNLCEAGIVFMRTLVESTSPAAERIRAFTVYSLAAI